MLKTFSVVAPFIKYNAKKVRIDNFVYHLHYRWTFVILLIFTILVTSQQYIGEHIKCISDSIPSQVINTYCFFTPTFTLVRHSNNSLLNSNVLFEPGIGPYETENEPIKRHAYYQWVPFVLFLQSICFYVPHALWKSWEGGRIKALVYGLKMTGLTQYLKNNSTKMGKLRIPCQDEVDSRVSDMRTTMISRMRLNQFWGAHLVFSEVLNLFNLVFQIYFTNIFLGGAFYTLGLKVLHENWSGKRNALDLIFPKVTKCHFRKFGPSGSLQLHDTLCVMALNIINEKIYTILWFWYSVLLCLTILALIWRVLTMLCYKNEKFSWWIFSWNSSGRISRYELQSVIAKCNFSNWMFLLFLRENIAEFLFKKFIFNLADDLQEAEQVNVAETDPGLDTVDYSALLPRKDE